MLAPTTCLAGILPDQIKLGFLLGVSWLVNVCLGQALQIEERALQWKNQITPQVLGQSPSMLMWAHGQPTQKGHPHKHCNELMSAHQRKHNKNTHTQHNIGVEELSRPKGPGLKFHYMPCWVHVIPHYQSTQWFQWHSLMGVHRGKQNNSGAICNGGTEPAPEGHLSRGQCMT